MTSRSFLRIRLLALAALTVALAGCKTWQPSQVSPQRLIGELDPPSVRITTFDGSVVTLRHPLMANDSIVSTEGSARATAFTRPRPGVAFADVRSVEVPRFSPARTVGLAAVLIGLGVAWTRTLGDSEGGSTEPTPPLPKTPAFSLWGIRFVIGGGG